MSFRLVSADVVAFGKLKNFHYDFCDGFNVLCKDNGFGKSTFATFLKAVFYGIGSSKKADLAQNDHKHYQPYDTTSKFGGSLVFVFANKRYRVERFFGNVPREHTFKLYDDESNKLLQNGVDEAHGELGVRLFGIDAEAFERCLYLPQKDVVVSSNDSFLQKLSNLAENTTEQNNGKKACEALSKFYKNYKLDKGEGGILNDLKRQKEQKERALADSLLVQQRIDSLNKGILTCTQELTEVDKKRQEIKEQEQGLAQREKQIANVEQIKKIEKQIGDKTAEEKVLSRQIAEINLPSQPIAQPIRASHEVVCEPTKPTKGYTVAKILCAILLAVGVGVFFANALIGGVIFGVALVGLALAFALGNKAKRLAKERSAQEQAQNQRKEQDYQIKLKKYEQYVFDKEKSDELKTLLSATQIAKQDLQQQLADLAPNGVEELKRTEQNLSLEKNQLKAKQQRTEDQYDALKNKLLADKKELEMREELFCLPSEIAGDIEGLDVAIEQARIKYNCAKKAMELIQTAKENLTQGYLPKLNRLLNQNLAQLSNFDFTQATVDANFVVKLQEGGQFREMGYFSTGSREVCDFALRLALMQCIYGEDLPLLILDDPFVNLDDKNYESATTLLKKLSQNTQILYLTCTERKN